MIKISALFVLIVFVSLGNCSQTPVKPDEERHLELLWEHQYEKESASISTVANSPTLIDENGLLLAIDYGITKINTRTGSAEWRYDLPEGSRFGNRKVLFDNSAVYIKHNMNNSSNSFDLETGKEIWRLNINGEMFFDAISDIMSNEHLFWAGKDTDIYQVSKTGELIKQMSLNYRMRSGHYLNGDLIMAHSFRDKDRAQHANQRFGKIISYDLDADTVKWEYDNEYGGYTYAPILIEEGIIYAGSTGGVNEFTAIDAETGDVIWRTLGQESWAYTLGPDAIYINDGTDLAALDKTEGRRLWTTSFPGGGFDQANLAYLEGFVYHSHSGSFFVLDAQTGEILYSTALPDGSYAGNVSAGYGKVFVQSYFNLFCYKGWEELP